MILSTAYNLNDNSTLTKLTIKHARNILKINQIKRFNVVVDNLEVEIRCNSMYLNILKQLLPKSKNVFSILQSNGIFIKNHLGENFNIIGINSTTVV